MDVATLQQRLAVGEPTVVLDIRPEAHELRDRAHALHASVRRLLALPGATRVLPAHASGPLPLDRAVWGARVEEVAARVPLARLPEEVFVEPVLASAPEVPEAYVRMVALNRAGAWPGEDEVGELEAGANRCALG